MSANSLGPWSTYLLVSAGIVISIVLPWLRAKLPIPQLVFGTGREYLLLRCVFSTDSSPRDRVQRREVCEPVRRALPGTHGTGRTEARERLTAREVDEAALASVWTSERGQVADVEAVRAAHDPSLDGRAEDPDPRPLSDAPGDDAVEVLADPRGRAGAPRPTCAPPLHFVRRRPPARCSAREIRRAPRAE